MKTTLRKIKSFTPCQFGWKKLIVGLGTNNLDTEVTILQILEINGVKDAFWALRTQEYRDYCLILADVAESVLHIFEEKYPCNDRPRKTIEAIRKLHAGEITDEELRATAAAAFETAHTARVAAYTAHADAYAVYVADVAVTAVIVADDVADAFADDVAEAAAHAVYANADTSHAANAAYARQWKVNEQILRKYLEEHNHE